MRKDKSRIVKQECKQDISTMLSPFLTISDALRRRSPMISLRTEIVIKKVLAYWLYPTRMQYGIRTKPIVIYIVYFILYYIMNLEQKIHFKKISWINKDKNNTFEFLSFEFVKYNSIIFFKSFSTKNRLTKSWWKYNNF